MDMIASELGAIIGLLALIAWELGSIKKHLRNED